MKKIKATWTKEVAENLKAFHSIDAEIELGYFLFFDLLRETHKSFGKEGLFKKYINEIFKEFGATLPDDDELKNMDIISKKFVNTKTNNKPLEFSTYEDFKKEIILKRIGK